MSVFAELNELRRLCDAPPHYFQHWTVGAHYDGTPRYGTAPPPDDTAPPPGDTSDDGNPPPFGSPPRAVQRTVWQYTAPQGRSLLITNVSHRIATRNNALVPTPVEDWLRRNTFAYWRANNMRRTDAALLPTILSGPCAVLFPAGTQADLNLIFPEPPSAGTFDLFLKFTGWLCDPIAAQRLQPLLTTFS